MGVKIAITLNTKKIVKSIEDTAAKRVYEAANEIRNVVLETLSGNRSGRTYRVPSTRKTYTASAPGQPPAQATSALRESIKVVVKGKGRKVIGMVGTNLARGAPLEFGTYKMAARPWLRPSFEKAMGKVKKILSRKFL